MKIIFHKSRGLGDTIEKITTVTGIKAVVDAVSEVTKKDCGCNKRKDKLNKLFPYGSTETSSEQSTKDNSF
jgi:hypothetical protein